MRRLLLSIIWIVIAMPIAYAVSCSNAGPLQEDCEAIASSDLNAEEKQEAIGALLAGNTWLPAHDTALAWNRQILKDTSGNPALSGTPSASKGSIRNAWVKLLGLHPTTKQQGTLFHSGEGVALLSSNYDIVPHAGTLQGDCRTDYRPKPVSAALSLLVNSVQQGTGSEVAYAVNGDATFTAKLDVSQTTYVDRYKWYSYCCQWGGGCSEFGCWSYCTSWCGYCQLDRTETRNDHVLVEDTLEAKLYSDAPVASLTPIEQYGSTVKAVFSPAETANTYMKIGEQRYASQSIVYSTEIADPPFETLIVTAEAQEPEENTTMLIPAGWECELELRDHFGSTQLPCSTEYNGPMLSISSDRLFYKAGDPIHVSIVGMEEAEVLYAGQIHNASDELTLTSNPGFTRITAYAAGQEASISVGIINSSLWLLLLRILVLILIVAATYSLIRNWARRRLLWAAH